MFKRTLREQTLDSFNYQWKSFPSGEGLLNDDFFRKNVSEILSKEELCIDARWFKGKSVLDAGCGNGRWSYGFLKLGADVTAVDYSDAALETIKNSFGKNYANLTLRKENLLSLSEEIKREKYDLVFSWGVLHHTGDTFQALKNISALVKEDGLIYLYLYGVASLSALRRFKLELMRFYLSFLPFRTKEKLLKGGAKGEKEAHGLFDLYSPLINDRYSFSQIQEWLKSLGFPCIVQTIPHTEIFVRASREKSSADGFFLPSPSKPFWFERLQTGH